MAVWLIGNIVGHINSYSMLNWCSSTEIGDRGYTVLVFNQATRAQSRATWMAEGLDGRNKAQSLFTTTEGHVHKKITLLLR